MVLTVHLEDLFEMDCGQNPAGQAAEHQFSEEGNQAQDHFESSVCCILAVQ